jgi:hypothetical protein
MISSLRPITLTLAGLLGGLSSAGMTLAQTAVPTEAARSPSAAAPAKAAAPQPASKPAAPPVTQAQAGALAAPDFQTKEQLQKAGVRRCLQTAQSIGRATMTGSAQYAAVSTWNSKQPDNRFSVSMIGQQFAAGQNSVPNGLSGVFSVPTAEGNCDAAAVQIIPTVDPCSSMQAQILVKGRTLGNLAGVPLLQNAANAQVMLLPGANNSCVLVVLSTVYSE